MERFLCHFFKLEILLCSPTLTKVFLYPFQRPNLGRSQISMVDLFRENSQRLNPLSASVALI